ncbi:hypothetical protein DPMN_179810 [Dreissena polymorpha]|uniref:Uncharacterized protein n=1 Tax=Dreissena polymorpha TaxID=45954 RepID=A0A9D4IL41_DREPO|nr:hypothetical protein DPMN_179810 [Dreissena polymorpha]
MKTTALIKPSLPQEDFHDDWAINVVSRFEAIWQYLHRSSKENRFAHLRGFHDDWAKIVTSRVFTRKTSPPPPPPGSHVIQLTGTILELNSHIKETNVLTKFHENWAKNVTSKVITCFHYIHIEKNSPPTGSHVFYTGLDHFGTLFTRKTAPPPGSHVIQLTGTIFELNSHIK